MHQQEEQQQQVQTQVSMKKWMEQIQSIRPSAANTTHNSKQPAHYWLRSISCKYVIFSLLFIVMVSATAYLAMISLAAKQASRQLKIISPKIAVVSKQQYENGLVGLLYNIKQGQDGSAVQNIISFFKYNTYNIGKIVINLPQQMQQVQISLINQSLGKHIRVQEIQYTYEISQTDIFTKILQKMKTKYVFYFTSQWQITDSSFIEEAIQYLQQVVQIRQVIISGIGEQNKQILFSNDYQQANRINAQELVGFSLKPSLHRVSDSYFMRNIMKSNFKCKYSYNKQFQMKISKYFLEKGSYSVYLKKQYAKLVSNKLI